MNNFFPQNNKKRRSKKAQGMVEFALVLPILMLTIVGILE
ncbi:MAG: pilus assembly protein, partial [Anaerolineales bacterium]|nr:pilus assembly protein [Anaerolineales bacterium]